MATGNSRQRKRKPKKRLLKRMQNKLYFVFGVICVLFVVLIGRLMYIEYTSGDKYEKIVLAQQQYDSTIIPYQRGDILDSKGTILATCVDVYNVILDCKVLNANEDKISSTISYLELCFPEIKGETVRQQLADNPDGQYVVLAKKVSYEEMQKCQQFMDDEEKGKEIVGIWFEKEYVRKYPYNSLAAAVLGFSTSTQGVIGLEKQYNNELNGTNGRSYGYLNSDSNVEQTVVEPQNGNSVVLTLDANIQTIVEEAILKANAEMVAESAGTGEQTPEEGTQTGEAQTGEAQSTPTSSTLGSNNTAAIVMNPKNGEILAMASYPGFDLNNPKDLSALYTEEQLGEMSEEQKLDIVNNIWQNYPVTKTFEPGSTFKPFTVAMGLDSGTLQGDETYFCDGGEEVGGWTIGCVKRDGHGEEDIRWALANSCNDAMMQMVRVIGPSNFAKFMSVYGFGQKTGVDLPGEASTASLIFNEEQLAQTESNLATNSFGQNFNVTMIQLASAFCSLVNGGDMFQPHIVKRIVDESGDTVKEVSPVIMKRTVSKDVSEMLLDYMLTVVDEGTGKKAAVEGYQIAGKTGTAQKQPREENNYVVSFIGCAPYDDPEVVVYVAIDTPHVAAQDKCSYSSYIAKDIFEQILPYLNVKGIPVEGEE
ncbi:MAG: penicillin-binding protein 2 [Lachnospiraceae bacterium]|nr:penicillin-binding protein 2 [Lachnospiraceae bacterium]